MEIKLLMNNGQSLSACVSSRECLNLEEAIKAHSKFKLNSIVVVDTLEIKTAFIDDTQFIMED